MADKMTVREGVRNSALIKNPVLFEAIGVAPVVAMAVSVKTAVMLSVISTVELVIIESIACLLLRKLRQSFRVLIYAVLGVLINIPLFMFFNRFAPNETANVSIFIPVIAVNSLIALHCERIAVKNDFKTTFVDAVSASVGYVFIIFLVGTVRELLGSGTFYSIGLKLPVKFSGLLLPFGGFLLLGFFAAFMKMFLKKKYPDEKPEAAFNLSEISDMHFEDLTSTADEEFNPFGDFFAGGDGESSPAAEKEKPEKKKKLSVKREKKAKPEKEKKKKQPKTDGAARTDDDSAVRDERPAERRVYESEFDDLLAEFEASRSTADADETPAEADTGGQDTTQGGDEQ